MNASAPTAFLFNSTFFAFNLDFVVNVLVSIEITTLTSSIGMTPTFYLEILAGLHLGFEIEGGGDFP